MPRQTFRCALFAAAFAVAAATPAAGAPAPVELWNGASAGMSIDQVYGLFPASTPTTGRSLAAGAIEALALPATIDGAPARAEFFFRDRTLEAVLVERTGLTSQARAANLAEARRIVSLAQATYGPASRCAERPEIAAVSCIWRAHGLEVGVSYHDFGGGSPTLSIRYAAAP